MVDRNRREAYLLPRLSHIFQHLLSILQGLSDDPTLQQGVDENGDAVISRWWSGWFFEGTREQQEARLNGLRLDPQFQKPWTEGEIPVRLEGGARCDDVYLKQRERKQTE